MTLTDEPQPILVVPVVDLITNRTALISWEFPGGQVDEYLVQYKERLNDWTTPSDILVRSVAGNVTMVMLTDLIPSASYDVRVASVNEMGTSEFLFQGEFSTQGKCLYLAHTVYMNSGVQDMQLQSPLRTHIHIHTPHITHIHTQLPSPPTHPPTHSTLTAHCLRSQGSHCW